MCALQAIASLSFFTQTLCFDKTLNWIKVESLSYYKTSFPYLPKVSNRASDKTFFFRGDNRKCDKNLAAKTWMGRWWGLKVPTWKEYNECGFCCTGSSSICSKWGKCSKDAPGVIIVPSSQSVFILPPVDTCRCLCIRCDSLRGDLQTWQKQEINWKPGSCLLY